MNSRFRDSFRACRAVLGITALCLTLSLTLSALSPAYAATGAPRIRMQTNLGTVVLELDAARAPLTVANVLAYVKSGQYNGTIFHRVIANFMIQGGGYTDKNVEKPTQKAVVNESGNGLSNRRGTVAMARTSDPHSGTSQFYINVADNVGLDPQPGRWGYTVFGRVVEGMDVVQKISETPTGASGALEDAPIKQVIIEKMEIVE